MDENKYNGQEESQKVVVTDVRMPFWSMVVFMIKLVFASIPAVIIMYVVMIILVLIAVFLTGSVFSLNELFEQGSSAF